MNQSLHWMLSLGLLGALTLIEPGCATAPPPAPAPRVHRGGGDQPYFATDVPDDVPPRQSTFTHIATSTGTSISKFFVNLAYIPVNIYHHFNGAKPSDAARKMEDPNSADTRRQGIAELVEFKFAKVEPYTRRYRQLGQFDSDAIVRAEAIRASNISRDPLATPDFVKALSDTSPLVRLEACKALVHLPDMNAVTPLLALLEKHDEDRDIRIAAADALKHYRTPTVARALISQLSERDFGIAWQSRQSLRYLTDSDYQYDEGGWLTYLSGPDKPFG